MKRILPVALIVMGLLLLSGCFFVPRFNPVISGTDVTDKVGDANSSRTLRVGNVSMDQVIDLLGPPQYASLDGHRVAYTWTVLNGDWVYPLCFAAQPQTGGRALELTFDQNNMLEDYHLNKVDGSWQLMSSSFQFPPVSGDMHSLHSKMPIHLPTTRHVQIPNTENTP
jgi:hypothetical protein